MEEFWDVRLLNTVITSFCGVECNPKFEYRLVRWIRLHLLWMNILLQAHLNKFRHRCGFSKKQRSSLEHHEGATENNGSPYWYAAMGDILRYISHQNFHLTYLMRAMLFDILVLFHMMSFFLILFCFDEFLPSFECWVVLGWWNDKNPQGFQDWNTGDISMNNWLIGILAFGALETRSWFPGCLGWLLVGLTLTRNETTSQYKKGSIFFLTARYHGI